MSLEAVSFPTFRASRGLTEATASRFVGEADAFRHLRFRLEQVAATSATVLLLGETGSGKGLAAQYLHSLSSRRAAPFVTVDCTSLPATLVESELFGRERGAFTDARVAQVGRFEIAHGGTIFLDEIGDLPQEAQAKLLRILQCGEFERLGSPRTLRVDVRVIVATNRNLIDEVRAGRFRRDLYYRVNVFPIRMPPLRERRSDIPLLAEFLVHQLAKKHQRRIDAIPRAVLDTLMAHEWPGNVRELENVLERAVITSPDSTLCLLEPPNAETIDVAPGAATTRLVDVERAHILGVLRAVAWRIEGPRGAAAALGLKPSTLRSRMRKLGLARSSQSGIAHTSRVA
ncbi:MAG TPA: sigma-54 dependent transcriptional regulator [Vicinamibacterales bacterium]